MSPRVVRPKQGAPYTEPRTRWGYVPPRPVPPVDGQQPLPYPEPERAR